ncbi:MAG: hypothetical protein ACLP81_09445 [Acidimicrobiales bacterium]
MKRFKSISRTAKIVTIGATVALTLGLAGTAFAYFTSTGSGTGSATVGAPTVWGVTVTNVGTPVLYPTALVANGDGTYSYSGPVQEFKVVVKNNGSGYQKLNQINVSIATSTGGTWTSTNSTYSGEGACTANDFTLGFAGDYAAPGATIQWGGFSSGNDLAPGASFPTEIGYIGMADTGVAQDNCQGVTVPLYVVAS